MPIIKNENDGFYELGKAYPAFKKHEVVEAFLAIWEDT
jgi:hypothetical protein